MITYQAEGAGENSAAGAVPCSACTDTPKAAGGGREEKKTKTERKQKERERAEIEGLQLGLASFIGLELNAGMWGASGSHQPVGPP